MEVKEPASLYLEVPIVEFNKLGEELLLFVRVVGKGCLRRLIVYWDVEWVIKAHVHELWEACLIHLRIIVLTNGFLKLIKVFGNVQGLTELAIRTEEKVLAFDSHSSPIEAKSGLEVIPDFSQSGQSFV